jgi:transposase
MSLPNFSTQSSLFSAALLPGYFAQTDRYRLFAQKIYPLVVKARPILAQAYCLDNGRPGTEPVLLTCLSLLQFIDGVPDRQAIEMLRYHAGWNFALNRQLGDRLFHHTVLSYYRGRMIQQGKSSTAFVAILDGLIQAGLVQQRSRQRLDSMQIFGLVSRMSRLECVRETLRLALKELEQSAGAFGQPSFWGTMWERYVDNKLDYRMDTAGYKTKMDQAGQDGEQLLEWVKKLSDAKVKQGAQVELLQRVWDEHFDRVAGAAPVQKAAQPSGAVHNPHEPQAQWASKGQGKHRKEHVGYKLQVAETVQETTVQAGEPTRSFITAMVTQEAIGSDDVGLVAVEKEQAAMGLEKPPQLYVDGAYVSAKGLAQAKAQGREIIGPAQPAPKKPGRFSVEDFQIHVEERQGICPAGKPNTQCSRLEEDKSGRVNFRFEWSTQCADCTWREKCLGQGQKHRTVLVGEHHTHLQARRQEQKTQDFQQKYSRRNAVEGTQSELVRGHGARRARYRGLEKVRLQNYFIGAACNAKRWIRRMIWEMKQANIAAKVSPGIALAGA